MTIFSVSIAFRLWCPFGRHQSGGGNVPPSYRVSIAFRLWCPFGQRHRETQMGGGFGTWFRRQCVLTMHSGCEVLTSTGA